MFRHLKALATAINRRAGLTFERTYLYRLGRPAARPAVSPADAAVRWSLLSPDRVDWLLEIGEFNVSEGSDRLDRGDPCYIACLDGRLAHYSWVQRSGAHPITEAGKSVVVAAGEFWIYNCRTAEWARGKGIYPAALARILTDHFDTGYSVAWIYTSRHNIASQRGITRAGFTLTATLKAFRIGCRYCHVGGRVRG